MLQHIWGKAGGENKLYNFARPLSPVFNHDMCLPSAMAEWIMPKKLDMTISLYLTVDFVDMVRYSDQVCLEEV